LRKVRREMKARWEKEEEENVERLVADLPKRPKRALERVRKENMSGWLTVGPSKQYGFDLSREMFRDRLNLRHGQELRGLPSVCDGCGAPFSLEHALNCMKGGSIKLGHDQALTCPARCFATASTCVMGRSCGGCPRCVMAVEHLSVWSTP